MRHEPIDEQGWKLARMLEGHYAYFAVPTNIEAVRSFRHHVKIRWYRSLRRRSQRHSLNLAADEHHRGEAVADTARPSPMGRRSDFSSNTVGRSRMPELGSSGSVRGAASNGRPYRDRRTVPNAEVRAPVLA